MPKGGPLKVSDWLNAYMNEGITPTLDSGIENTPDNKIKDAGLQDLADDGGTKTMRVIAGPQLDGYHFYSTSAGQKQSGLIKQTALPRPLKNNSRLDEEPIVDLGQKPQLPYDPALPQLVVSKIPLADTKQGFAGGWRLAAVGLKNRLTGARTTTTEPIPFQHGNGQRIQWYPLSEIPAGPWVSVLYLSKEATTEAALRVSTMREQDSAAKRTRIKTARGPFEDKNAPRPLTNETYIGRPAPPRWSNREIRTGPAPGDTLPMFDFAVFFVFSTPRGDTLGGIRSRNRHISAAKDRAVYVKPKNPPRDATGVKPHVVIEGKIYRVLRRRTVYNDLAFPLDRPIPIYGNIVDDAQSAPLKTGRTTVLVAAASPETDESGIEGPSGEADAPIGIGFTRPGAGMYWKTYAPVRGGVEQRAAVPVKATITASEMLNLEVPNPVNRLSNPAGTGRGADGSVLEWNANLTNGVLADAVGKLGVATSGLVNDTTGTPYRQSVRMPVNSGVVETVRGVLEVSNYAGTAGYGQHSLIQYLTDGSATLTILARAATNISTEYAMTIGPTGSGADIILDEGAIDVAIRIGTSADAGRNMTVRGYNLALHPFTGAPRKFLFPPAGTPDIADPNPPPEISYPPGPVVCITQPKSAAPPPSFVPVGVLNAPTDPVSQGFTEYRVPVNGNTGLLVGPPYRAFSNATNVRAQATWSKIYPLGSGTGFVNGSSLAIRGQFQFPLLPTATGYPLAFADIRDAASNLLAHLQVRPNGQIQMMARESNNKETVSNAIQISVSSVLDAELIVGGGDTNRGRVSLIGAADGGSRGELATIDGLDFRGRVPRQIVYMGIHEYSTTTRWEVLCDWLRVTNSGDVVEGGGDVSTLPPDRPTGADGVYRELDRNGEPVNQGYIHIPPNSGEEERGFVFDECFAKPDMPQTVAIYARYEDLAPQDTNTAQLVFYNAQGDAWVAPSPLPAGVSGTAGWTDLTQNLTPPSGYYRARLEVKRNVPGMLIIQEPVLADGTL